MITLSPAPAAVAAAQTWTSRPKTLSLRRPSLPRHFTVQAGPQAYLRQRLPQGLAGREIVEYVSAYARTRGHDCCIEYPSGRALYLLSDGGRFEAMDR